LADHHFSGGPRISSATFHVAQHPGNAGEVPRQGCERAAFAIAPVLEVDPVVRIDAVERNVVARTQNLHEDLPRVDLRLRRRPHDIRVVAGELDPDRGVLVHLVIGPGVVDVLVVVAVGAVGMGRNEMIRDRPIDGAVGLDPDHDAAPRRIPVLLLRAAARRARRPLGLVHDDVLPGMGARDIAPGREPDHLQARDIGRARLLCDRLEIGRLGEGRKGKRDG
jgi:hypothetical protein